jgi:UDP-2-acetamido-3-amino-2,3-dideoxy-glucuronate N-acetyltransferase
MNGYFKHETALVESQQIGEGTRIWAFAHVLAGAVLGKHCNVGDHCFIEAGVTIGDNVTIKNHTAIWEGVTLADNVFVGPNVVFTNDMRPRSPRLPLVAERYRTKAWLSKTVIREGASLGANAIILGGLEIGEYAMIGAGALVTKNVPPYALVIGAPGRVQGYVCRCGEKLDFCQERAACPICRSRYAMQANGQVSYS